VPDLSAPATPRSGAAGSIVAFGACALALAVRLYRLGSESLWYDEAVSAYLAELPIGEMVAHTSLDIHPPGYYLLLHLWTAVAGQSEFALAFLSLAAGVIAVAAIRRLTHSIADAGTANLAAGLAVVSTYGVWYSQEVRMYTVAALLMLSLLSVTLRLREGCAGHRWALWGLLGALSLYTVYYSLFLLPVLSVAWLHAALRDGARRGARLRRWAAGQGVAVLLYLPWLPTAIRQALEPPVPPWRSFLPWHEVLSQGATALAFGESAPAVWWPAALLLLIGAVRPLLSPASPAAGRWPAISFLAPWALMLAASALQPLFHPRYLYPFSPFFTVSLALGLVGLARVGQGRWLALALATLYFGGNLLSAGRMWTRPEYRPDDLRSAIGSLAERWLPGDAILFQAGYTYAALEHYWPGPIAWRGRVPDYESQLAAAGPVVLQGGSLHSDANLGWGRPEADFYGTTLDETVGGLTRALEANRRLWVFRLYDTVTDPAGEVRAWLSTALVLISDEPIPGPSFGRLQSYVLGQEDAVCSAPVSWGQRAQTCVQVGDPAQMAGKVSVPVYVSVKRLPAADGEGPLHYTLRLRATDGTTLAQADGALVLDGGAASESCYVLNPLPAPLAAGVTGPFRVALGLYVFQNGVPVPLAPEDDAGANVAGDDGLVVVGEIALP